MSTFKASKQPILRLTWAKKPVLVPTMSACWHVALLMVLFSIQSRRTHAAGSSPRSAQVTSMLPQNGGAWFGSAVDASAYNYKLSNYTRKLGIEPASYILFAHLPLTTSDKTLLSYMLPQMGRKRAICLFTVELAGLNSSVVTDDHLKELAQFLATYEQQGVTFIVRFAHEMNGSWYPWAQQPIAYRQMFRKAAEMIYQYTCSATMLWAPNEAAGYPFRGVLVRDCSIGLGYFWQDMLHAARVAVVCQDCSVTQLKAAVCA